MHKAHASYEVVSVFGIHDVRQAHVRMWQRELGIIAIASTLVIFTLLALFV